MARPDKLSVFLNEELVGTIHDASPLAFEYAPAWLTRAARLGVSTIPLQPGRNDSTAVQACFENLLPEGELRDYLAERKKSSTLFAMLLEVAGDTAGGFTILPAGQVPEAPVYESTSWPRLAARLRETSASAIDIKGSNARISLAGAQDKTSLAIFADGVPRIPAGTAPSTHILKPDIRRMSKVWQSAANETITMLTAAKCGLPTAGVFFEPQTGSCVVRRFDRVTHEDGSLERLIQYDLCQLAGTVSERKYEKEGGPGIAACATLIRQYSSQPAVDLRNFVQWILFNLYTGNNHSHAKNLSIIHIPGAGTRLAPFYDLMCTRMYPGLSQEFAFAIGGETAPGSITQTHIAAMAEQLNMRTAFVLSLADALAKKLPAAMEQAIAEARPSLSPSAKTLAKRLKDFVLSATAKGTARIVG